jgi:ubiquinone/menaquinone biosynthesis C-methylase UbiE
VRPDREIAVNAELVSGVGRRLVELAGVRPGMRVLDVACGAGNASIPAAQAGARVTAIDPSGDLLAIARERAADYMVEIDWIEGGVERLPFPDGSFDRVLSVFGHVFAPKADETTAEMRRVLDGDGVIAVAVWEPDSSALEPLGERTSEHGTLNVDGDERAYVIAAVRAG